MGQNERAIEDSDRAIDLNPKRAESYVTRALAYTLLGNDEQAEHDVDRAVQLGFDRALLEGSVEEFKAQR